MKTLPALLSLIGITFITVSARAQPFDFSQIDNLLEDNLEEIYHNNVVCMVKKDGELIYYRAFGNYDSTSNALIASVSKSFSAAVLLSLVDDGMLSLDDSIGAYLPQFTQQGKGSPTIRQCFSHTAGFPSNSDFESGLNANSLAQAADSIALNENLIYPPGSAFLYGGTSMHIVGRVAEIASGKSWFQLFNQRLVQPLGLENSFFVNLFNPRIAGGMSSNPSDMMKLAEMLLNNGVYNGVEVLSPAAVNEMWTDQTNQVPQLFSPYPSNPVYNNPYGASTIYYGIGSWLDVFHPQSNYQEQISGAGAFGSLFWVDRCRGITGVIFTFSDYEITFPISHQIVDVVRNAIPPSCPGATAVLENENTPEWGLFPNPVGDFLTLNTGMNYFHGSIFDARGAQILAFENKREVNVSALPSGMYVLKLSKTSGVSQGQLKFIKR